MKLGETCDNCGLKCTKDLQTSKNAKGRAIYADPCLGILPGVKHSCCGHGDTGGYIFFENGVVIRFHDDPQVEKILVSPFHKFNEQTTKEKGL